MKAEKAAKVASQKPKHAAEPQPAKVVKSRLPRNYSWAPTADGKPGYVIR